MNQPRKPIPAAHAERVPMSKVKLAAILTALCAAAVAAVTLAGRSTAAVATTTQTKPTVVLVHGAWANNASWASVIERLSLSRWPMLSAAAT
jgi:pimeloyl-ACP methyl ester carboxylesterase